MFGEIEQKIIERLKQRLPEDVHVAPLRELERVPELRQKAPAVWVIHDGYTAGERLPNLPHVQQIRQEWFVVVAAKSAKRNGDQGDARDQASELCEIVLGALLGFHLGSGKYLQLADAPGPEYDAGYCHVPLAFTNAATFKGQP